jgi:chromosome partitioning protein
MGRIIAVANQKGGVAKTTTATTIASAFAEAGRRVLLVDLDAQACATFSLGIDPEDLPPELPRSYLSGEGDPPIIRTDEGVDLLPATIELASADHDFAHQPGRERMLEQVLGPLMGTYHFVVIDCSPSLGLMTINALVAADEVLVPLKCETLAHRGLGQLLEAIDEVQRWANPKLRVAGLVPTLHDGRTMHARAVLADLGPRFGVPVLDPIPRSVRFAEAPAVGRTILATAPRSEGAAAYRRVAQALDS